MFDFFGVVMAGVLIKTELDEDKVGHGNFLRYS